MNLSEQDNMLTEILLGENVGEFQEGSAMTISISQDDLSGQRPSKGKDTSEFDSSDLASDIEPSAQRDDEAEVSVGIDKTCKPSHPLIVYTSSRRRGACDTKLNQNNECPKPSKCKTANENSDFDFSSLQILRRNRSSFSNRARSSVWGYLGNVLRDIGEKSGIDLNLGNEEKISARSGQGKKNSIRDQAGRKSIAEKCPPTGHISLKVKIGNKICRVPTGTGSARERKLEKVISSDASALSTHLDARGTFDNPSFNSSSDFNQSISLEEGDNLGASFENRCSDVGTSPDSEVINSVPDASICEKGFLPHIQDSRIMSMAHVSPGDVSNLIILQKKSKKGNKKDKLHEVGDFCVEKKSTSAEITNNDKVPAHLEVDQKVVDVSYSSDASMVTIAKPHVNDAETNPCSGRVSAIVSSNSQVCDKLVPCSNGRKSPKCSRAKGGSKGSSRSLDLPSKKDRASKKKGDKNNVGGKRQVDEKVGASGVPSRVENLVAAGNQIPSELGEARASGKDLSGPINCLEISSDGAKEEYISTRNAWVLCDECQKWRRIPATLADQIEGTNCRWTCKDNEDKDFADCSIPQEKSNSEINEELEISNASCEEDARGTFLESKQSLSKVAQQSSWSLIKSNLFQHRIRKTQTIDEVMVCHCKPPSDGRMGCGAKCLNRMLNIECVRGTCPCGELCSNQQFQRRKYAKLKWFKCGKKGYGLQALEDISQGQFLIEYVGEVLDVHAYEDRQREYALNAHKHFYFMTLNRSEVIDASAKGNLGRFINHSCDPNCRTEKWMVNGEVCVGLFSLRDIKKGDEVTFDYNYVRVFGAAAKKCVCGSPNCRGYIGGDPTNSEIIVQDNSDDEYSEPVMICGDKELNKDWKEIMSNSLNNGENEIANEPLKNRYSMEKLISSAGQSTKESHTSQTLTEKVKDAVNSSKVDIFACNDSAANSVERLDINKMSGESLNGFGSATSKVESKRKLKYATVGGIEELAKFISLGKTNGSSSSVKKGKAKTNTVNDKRTPNVDKLNAVVHKSKEIQELSLNSHFEAVEEKLNQLLDPEGGISKRKDASRGYLKLLFLTAASGNNGHGEAIQSNRDLSMILGALLKTKSRTVLVDIINKNGLQMLHNIMKRYRKEFNKTPILRKLLRVLEYLAVREILTLEHISGGPSCPGVESFKDSILTLIEHADRQIHQIARNFRDRWIPKPVRKNCCTERNNGPSVSYDHRIQRNGKPSYAINSRAMQSGTIETNGTKTRKRKSGWDNPADEHPHSRSRTDLTGDDEKLKMDEYTPPGFSAANGTITCKRKSRWDNPHSRSRTDLTGDDEKLKMDEYTPPGLSAANGTKTCKRKNRWDNPVDEHPHSRSRTGLTGDDENLKTDENTPPGFSSPCNGPMVSSNASSTGNNHRDSEACIKQHPFDIVSGDLQSRYGARLPVSYGVSYSAVQQCGVRQGETSEGWKIAPGVPFYLFPPLPRGNRECPTSDARCTILSEPAEKAEQFSNT